MHLSPEQKAALFMRRFQGRRDVYARKWYDKEGKGNYAPVCENIWKPGCHLKLKDGITCARCEIRKFEPVSQKSVLKHINGEEEHSIYVVQEGGLIDFGAFDLDNKPNKNPKDCYTFDEVKQISDVMDEFGIKHAIARSTSDGHHIYCFFDKPYPAVKFLAVMRSLVVERAGIGELNRCGLKSLPEIFPKQTSPGGDGGLGNPIKPPMIETRWDVGKNCWITKDNQMIPKDQQWEYFEKILDNTSEIFDELIKINGLEIKEEAQPVSGSGTFIRVGGATINTATGEYQPPTTGSMEKLIEGCSAFRRLRSKMDTGHIPGHDEGFALFQSGAMHTQDGMKYFEEGKVPGWAQTPKDWQQLKQSIDKNYSPWTCRKMQEKGICVPGTKCFDKIARKETIQGQQVVRDDLPENQWPDPSPIRYAKGAGDDFLQKLIKEIDDLETEVDAEKKGAKIKEISIRAQVFDKDQQTILKQHIDKRGFMKKKDLGRMFNQAEREKTDELTKVASGRTDSRNINGVIYRKKKPYGYEVSRKVKGNSEGFSDICNFDMTIKEIKTVIDEDDPVPKSKYYRGVFSFDGVDKPFEISAADFYDNPELFKLIGSTLDMRAGVQKSEIDDLRSAVQAFSGVCSDAIYRAAQGWYDDVYIMPEVMVDKLGVRSNEERPLEIVRGAHAQYLGFKYMSDTEVKDIMSHMKNDLFNAFPRGPLFVGLAHTLLGAIVTPLGLKQKPTLWYEGVSGRGKSTMTYLFQQFYGKFPVFQNWMGSYKGMLDNCHRFKDTTLVIDDYKSYNENQKQAAEMTIQYGYDGNSRSVLTREGTQRGDKGSRCLLICSGEDTPFGQASIISRMLVIPYPKSETSNTRIYLEKCLENQDKYCAVTPKFIHYFLNRDVNTVKKEMRLMEDELLGPVRNQLNAPRICMHYAWNYVTWKLFMDFMLEQCSIDQKEHAAFLAEHYKYVREYRDLTIYRCASEQHGRVLMDVLRELIISGRVSITGLEGFEHEHTKAIGFVSPNEPEAIYIHPGLAMAEAKRESVHINVKMSAKAIGEQMISDGIIIEHDTNTDTKMVVDPNRSKDQGRKVQGRMWMIRLSKLGIDGHNAPIAKPVPLSLPKPAIEEGLI